MLSSFRTPGSSATGRAAPPHRNIQKAKNRFAKLSDLDSAREMIEQILSTKESRAKYYNSSSDGLIEDLKKEYDLIYQSLSKPIIRLEAACFMWLVKR